MSDAIQSAPALHGDRPAAASAQGLADRNELAAIAVERTRMPMVISDPRQPDNPIVLANAAFLELTGYSGAEVIGRNCRFLQGPETSRSTVDAIRSALKHKREFEVEILNYRKDGSTFWNLLSLSPVHDDNGELLYVFASQIDATELRKVQGLKASEHRLLKEVDHRANNALAVVSAIVRLSRSDDSQRYAEAIQDRVQVLARAHTLLAERGWRDLALKDLIDNVLGRLDRSRVSLESSEIMVPAVRVQPLALVFHELLDNAMNHGALSVPGGRVSVQWTGLEEAGGFRLRWREDGAPAPAPDPGRGFGEIMIRSTIERQLHGRVEREWRPEGLAVRMEIPGISPTR